MDSKKLKTFRYAANLLSFSDAADQLGYVQSAVTNQIKALEQILGVSLFERTGRGVLLTDSGKLLLNYANKIHAIENEAKTVLSGHLELSSIRIGGYETIITYYLPRLLNEFSSLHPHSRFSIYPTPVSKLIEDLHRQRIDVAFVLGGVSHHSGLNIYRFSTEDIVIVCAPFHTLAQHEHVSLSALSNAHLLLTEVGCSYRNQFERMLIEAGAYSRDYSEFVSIEALKACAKLGMGVAALSRSSVQQDLDEGTLVTLNIDIEPMHSEVYCITTSDNEKAEHIQEFIRFCLQHLDSLSMN